MCLVLFKTQPSSVNNKIRLILATLLYIKNNKGEYLLIERLRDPNRGLMSPPGGKLDTAEAESPVQCAVREAFEECRMNTGPLDWMLKGIVTEKDYPSVGNIMLFLMEYKNFVNELPEVCNEGAFHFVHPDDFKNHNIPITDKLFLWDNMFKNDREVFVMTLDCKNHPDIKQVNV